MNRIYNFNLFLESKNQKNNSNEVKKEVKKIISEMFSVGKNIKFSGEQDEEPKFVDFEVDSKDFKLGYDEELKMDYSEGVLTKRKYQVSLKFEKKYREGTENDPLYKMRFSIKLKPISEIKFDKKTEESMIGWNFEEKPKEVIKFIRSEKKNCKWNDVTGVLSMTKKSYDSCDKDELKILIRDAGGEKVRL